jgi:hypothetical protein
MVHDLGEANRDWAKLTPAPRVAPLWFRWRWLVLRPILVLVGSAIFGCACLASMAFAVNTDPIGTWRLAMARREAPGEVKGVGRMGWLALCWFGGMPLGWILGIIERAVHWH